jgi:hypothetical protein
VEVAVVAVEVMESAVDEVVVMVSVRDQGMPASGVVPGGALDGRARRRVSAVDGEDVLGHARFGGGMQVPVVEIIGVVAMPNRPMTAARPVLVGMPVPVLHGVSPSSGGSIGPRAGRGQAGGERR